MKLPLPEPLHVEIGERRFVLPPPTRAQVRACLALDPEDAAAETPGERDTRTAAQLRALLGPQITPCDAEGRPTGEPALALDSLTGEQERDLLTAIYMHHLGYDAAQSVALHRVVKKNVSAAVLAASDWNGSPASTGTP